MHRVRRPASRPARDRERPARAAPRGPPARLPDHARAGGVAAALGLARRARRLRLAPLQARGAPGHGARRRRPRGPAAREPGRACAPGIAGSTVDGAGSAAQVPVEALPDDASTVRRPRPPGRHARAGRFCRGPGPAAIGAGRVGRRLRRPGALAPKPARRRRRRPRTSAARPPRAARRHHRAMPDASRSRARTTRSPPPRTRPRSTAPSDNTPLVLIAAGLIVVGVLLVALRLGARLVA